MFRFLLSTFLLSFACQADANPQWHFEDRFSNREKQELQEWVLHSEQGMTMLFGDLPYPYRVHFHRSKKGRGPTPWAHTDKRRGRAVHFHVNTAYAWELFRKDWTASHELSHLMFPYLGREGSWFAEGLASYLQYQIMYANKTVSWKQVGNKLEERFRAAQRTPDYDNLSIVNLSNIASHRGPFVRLYWGGAAYFMNVDMALNKQIGRGLNTVIKDYLACCLYKNYQSAEDMIEAFDKISGTRIFSQTFKQTVAQKGFPETATALAWLQDNPPRILR